jgi:hypothetical protein
MSGPTADECLAAKEKRGGVAAAAVGARTIGVTPLDDAG